jgi:putative ABC transport system permease protein
MKKKRQNPPFIANLLANIIFPKNDNSYLHGDFKEIYFHLFETEGRFSAWRWYWWQILISLPHFFSESIFWRMSMFKNYFKIALRNLFKYKYYSSINILGLTVGITCCLLIMLYIKHELSYDRYHEKADQTYRVVFAGSFGGSDMNFASIAAVTSEALLNDFPEVENVTRICKAETQRTRVRYQDKTFVETKLAYTDASLFEVFTFPLLAGNVQSALSEPNSLVISENTAKKYFGNEDPIGKTLTFNSSTDFKVTGIFQEIPSNTHFHFNFFVSLNTLEESRDQGWLNNMIYRTYIILHKDVDYKNLEAKYPNMVKKYIAPMFEKNRGKSYEQITAEGLKIQYFLQPVTDIHLYSDLQHELEPNGDIKYVYIFAAIALFILLMACINFMNLSTARSSNRAKEVGLRKTVGSYRYQLITQFLIESVMMSLFALILAGLLTYLALPYFNNLAGKDLILDFNSNWILGIFVFITIVLVGLLAGSYPAFMLSSFKPVTALKQKMTSTSSGRFVRSGLVVFQFIISITLIIGTLVVNKQLQFVQNKKLGFNKEQVLILHDSYILDQNIETFKNQLFQNPEITSASVSGYLPVTSERTEDVVLPEGIYRESGTAIQTWAVDFDYVKTLGMEIVAGRDFSRNFITDSSAMIVNEAAVKHFGWENPIGKHIGDYNLDRTLIDYPVIGVVKDFHFESLKDYIGPLALFIGPNQEFLSIRLKTENISQTIARIENNWNRFANGQAFEYSFLDDRFSAMYKVEERIGDIFSIFASLAIFIGCLGLLGLAAFTAETRTKEIGIRKVLGSSISSVVILLTKEFVKWIFIAICIAWPIAFLIMNKWLQNFAYRANLDILTFVISGVVILLVTFLTVSYQAIKAATANPINSLKYE